MLILFDANVSIESIKTNYGGCVHDLDITFPDMPELNNKQTVDLICEIGSHADILMIMRGKPSSPAFFIDACPSSLTKKLHARLEAILAGIVVLVRTSPDVQAGDDMYKFSRWIHGILTGPTNVRLLQTWFDCTSLVLALDTRMRETMQWHYASTRNVILQGMDATIPPSKKLKRIVNKSNLIADAEAACLAAFMTGT